MLTEDSIISQIGVDEHGNVSVRRSTRVYRDGVMIAENYHRHVLAPGDDLAGQAPEVVAIARVAHTRERIAARAERDRASATIGAPVVPTA